MKFRDQKNYLVSSKGYRMKMGFINKINLQNDGRTLNRFIEIEKKWDNGDFRTANWHYLFEYCTKNWASPR